MRSASTSDGSGLREHLATLSPEEIAAETLRAAQEGDFPFSSYSERSQQPQEDDSSCFTAADLTSGALADGVRFPIPGTQKALYVLAMSQADRRQLIRWSLERDLEEEGEARTPLARRLQDHNLLQRAKVWQVILCCRKGAARNSGRCFSLGDYHAVEQHLGFAVVDAICALSDQLSGGDERIEAASRRFFVLTLDCLRNWLSASAGWDGCPPGLREKSTRLLSLGTAALSRGSWESGRIHDLGEAGTS